MADIESVVLRPVSCEQICTKRKELDKEVPSDLFFFPVLGGQVEITEELAAILVHDNVNS